MRMESSFAAKDYSSSATKSNHNNNLGSSVYFKNNTLAMLNSDVDSASQ